MIDLARVRDYRENNRVEAKLALGGLPESLWESYSAFANTLGGVILLGVEERKDKSFRPVDLPQAEAYVRAIRARLRDRKRVSADLLGPEDVAVETVEGCRIVVLTVPRAERQDRPVFLDGDPFRGTYRRRGDGDYRCGPEEVRAMQRDARRRSWDTRPLGKLGFRTLDPKSLASYREDLMETSPDEDWAALTDPELLLRRGGARRGQDHTLHPTGAGLLLLGRYRAIRREFPRFALRFREEGREDTFRGNLYSFYHFCLRRLRESPLWDGNALPPGVEDAFRAGLANCLINADYRGRGGIEIALTRDAITLINPGGFRMSPRAALSGGQSDPRNLGLMGLFRSVGLSDSQGRGIPGIYAAWQREGRGTPTLRESFRPDRTTLTLPFRPGEETPMTAREAAWLRESRRQAVIDYLTDHIAATEAELRTALRLPEGLCGELLYALQADGTVIETEAPTADTLRYQLRP